ncbi:hypothetical protein C8R46DRAFT_897569, partial [Mycena filopes]
YGYLYATGSKKRRTVAVPFNYGVGKLSSVNDLHVHVWVPNTSDVPHVVDMAVGRVNVASLPGSRVPLEFAYYIIYVPQSSGFPVPPNECRSLRSNRVWNGNILVLKQGKRKAVINVEKEDAFLVDALVSS